MWSCERIPAVIAYPRYQIMRCLEIAVEDSAFFIVVFRLPPTMHARLASWTLAERRIVGVVKCSSEVEGDVQ